MTRASIEPLAGLVTADVDMLLVCEEGRGETERGGVP